MTTLFGAVTFAGDSTFAPGNPFTPGSTVTTYPSTFTIPSPTLSPGTHVVPPVASSPTVIAVSAVAMSASTTLPTAASHTATTAVALTGSAVLATTGFRTQFPTVTTLAGTSTLIEQPWVNYLAAVAFTPNSVLTSGPIARALAGTALSASATLSASMLQKMFGQTSMSAAAALSLTGTVTTAGTVSSGWNALTTLASATSMTAVAGATFAPTTTMTVAARSTAVVSLALAPTTTLTVGPVTIAVSQTAWTATAALSTDGFRIAPAVATWAAVTTFAPSAFTVGFMGVGFAAQSVFLTDLRRIWTADPFTLTADSTLGPSVLTIVKVAVAIFVGDTTLTVLEPGVYPLIPPGFIPGTGPAQPVDKTPTWRLYVADTRTGRVSYELPMTAMQWQSKLNDIGTATATIDVQQTHDFLRDQDERDPRVLFRQFLSGAFRYSLCFAYGDTAVWAGPYTPGSVPSNAATVDVGASEFAYMLTKRLVTNNRFLMNDTSADVNLGPTTKSDMALSLIELATSGDSSYQLPWTCPHPPSAIGGVSRTYYGFDFATVWERLSSLSSESDGPDVRFDPKLTWRSDGLYLSYELQIGSPLLGALTPWAWDVPTSATVQWDTNVQNMASAYYGIGSGQDREKMNALITDNKLTYLGFPALEMVDSLHTSSVDFGELGSLTQADMTLYRTPAVKWTVNVQGSRDPTIGSFHCGDTFQVTVNDHAVIADGTYRRRITGLSGSLSDWVSISSADDYVVLNTTSTGVQIIANN